MKKIAIFLFVLPMLALASGENTGGFINLAQGIRAVGMGGAGVAIGEDVSSLYYNPGGLARITKKEILLGYTKHFADIGLSTISYGQPMGKGACGLSIFLMNTDGGEEADINGKTGKNVDVSGRSISLFYASRFNQNINLGGSIKSISQNYAGYKGSKLAYDVGILGEFKPLSLGFSLNNLGGDMEIDNVKNSLPFNIKTGIGYKMFENILICFDIEKPNDSSLRFHLGTEYNLLPNIDLRGGYDKIGGYSLGFGIRSFGRGIMQNVLAQIDYAFLYHPDLNSSHRVSVLTKF